MKYEYPIWRLNWSIKDHKGMLKLYGNTLGSESRNNYKKKIAELQSAIEALQREETPCKWTADEDGLLHTDCKNIHCFTHEPLPLFKFCIYCGKPIEFVGYKESTLEDESEDKDE